MLPYYGFALEYLIAYVLTPTKGTKMHCSNCGASVPENAKFCSHCGSPLRATQPAQPTQPVQPAQPAKSPRKKRHVVRWVLLTLLVAAILAFALAAVGIIPRFWSFASSNGGGEQATHDKWAAQDEETGVQVPETELTGVDPDSVRRTLEGAGFTDVKVEWFYDFDVYGDDTRDKRASQTTIKDGPDLKPGEFLQESTPIVVKALKAPGRDGIRQRIQDATNIENKLANDSTSLEGTWHGTRVESGDSDLNTSKCDADTRDDMMPIVTISDANNTALTVRANVQALMHYHSNDKPRTYDSNDDKFEDLGRLTGSDSIVMGHGEYSGHKVLYQELPAIMHPEQDDKGEAKDVEHTVSLHLAINSDLDKNMNDEELVSILSDVLGDDASKEFESEDEALDALQAALENSDHTWLTLVVDQNHGGILGSRFVEGYRLEKESSAPESATAE